MNGRGLKREGDRKRDKERRKGSFRNLRYLKNLNRVIMMMMMMLLMMMMAVAAVAVAAAACTSIKNTLCLSAFPLAS
jgi:hypothetical protein